MHAPSRRFVNAASFQIAATLVHWNPDVAVIETHPGGGQYDCLSVVREGREVVALNRAGRIRLLSPNDLDPIEWGAYLAAGDPLAFVGEIADAVGLAHGNGVSSAQSITLGVFAKLLAVTAGSASTWDVRSEVEDSSGYGAGRRRFVDAFAGARDRTEVRLDDDVLGEPRYRFWAVLQDETVRAMFETTGAAWTAGGVFDVVAEFRRGGLVFAMSRILAGLLP